MARAALGLVDLRGPAASVLHFVTVWGAALVTLPNLKLTPPRQCCGAAELIDGRRHLV